MNTWASLTSLFSKNMKGKTSFNCQHGNVKLTNMKNELIIFLLMVVSLTSCDKEPIATVEPTVIPDKRAHHEMVYDEASKSVLMVGGSTPLNGGQSFKFFNDIWKYDNTGWSKIGNAGDERSGIRLAYDSKRNKLLSYGGFTVNNQSSSQLRVLENGDWKILSDLPEMKSAEGGFVYDVSRDKFIAFGGTGATGQVNGTTWEWDGTAWKKFGGVEPAGRQSFVMVYDSKRNKTILYGGMNGSGNILEDGVWEFDGNEWKNFTTPVAPEPLMAPGYAFDSKQGVLVIFGGATKDGIKKDTWSWDGSAWKKLSDSGPSSRLMGYMAYDKDRDRVVLFGGRLGWPNDINDTWEWDGTKWNEIK
jgi:hypothetical protein